MKAELSLVPTLPQIVKEMLDTERDAPNGSSDAGIEKGQDAGTIKSSRPNTRATSKVRFLLEGLEIQELRYAVLLLSFGG